MQISYKSVRIFCDDPWNKHGKRNWETAKIEIRTPLK